MKKKTWLTILIAVFVTLIGISMKVDAGTKVSAPKISSENVASTGKIKITWEKVSGAEKYQIYRATSKSGKYTRISTTEKTSLTNTSATSGKTYYYYVVALSADGAKSAKSNIVSRTCDLKRPIITLSNVASTGKIKISWDEIDGAKEYQIYRAASKSGTYKRIVTTTKTSITNTSTESGKAYYYKVRAVASKSAANSAYSAVESRTCDLARPEVKVSLNESGKPQLKWNKVTGAVKYEVYRSMKSGGDYKLLKTTTSASFTNSTVAEGVKYYYKVRAIASKSAANSAYSKVVSVTPTLSEGSWQTKYVTSTQLNLFSSPDSSLESIRIPYMTEVKVGKAVTSGDAGKWYRVQYKGKEYYTWLDKGEERFTTKKSSFNYVSDENTKYQNEVLALATKIYKEWKTYYAHEQSNGVMNEDGAYGFDCSGFVTYCINTIMGEYIPTYKLSAAIGKLAATESVYNAGYGKKEFSVKTVKLEDIQPGDVIFFSLNYKNDHCGLYLGNNEFIQSTSYWDGVIISPLAETYLENISVIKRYVPKEASPINQKVDVTAVCGMYEHVNCTADYKIADVTLRPGADVTLLYTDSDKKAYIRYEKEDGSTVKGYVLLKNLSSK